MQIDEFMKAFTAKRTVELYKQSCINNDMKEKHISTICHATEFYNRQEQCVCTLVLEDGSTFKVLFNFDGSVAGI